MLVPVRQRIAWTIGRRTSPSACTFQRIGQQSLQALQLLLGDHDHVPFDPVLASERITIQVK